jgi:hypothetical protein
VSSCPCVDHVHAQATFEQLAQSLPDLEHQILFEQAVTPHRAMVPTTVARINHDAHLGHTSVQLQIFFRRRRNHDNQLVFLRFGRIREQIYRALGVRPDLALFSASAIARPSAPVIATALSATS